LFVFHVEAGGTPAVAQRFIAGIKAQDSNESAKTDG
jgi:hypothetical protein